MKLNLLFSETRLLDALQKPSSSVEYKMVTELCNVMSKQWIGYMATMSDYNDNYLHTALNLFIQTICVAELGSKVL